MARGKPKREKAAIPASYIRPRELPNGRTSYNVRAYDPATRTCKTLGTFKTKRAAERAFKKGAEALVANDRKVAEARGTSSEWRSNEETPGKALGGRSLGVGTSARARGASDPDGRRMTR